MKRKFSNESDHAHKILALKSVLRALIASLGKKQRNAITSSLESSFYEFENNHPEMKNELREIESLAHEIMSKT